MWAFSNQIVTLSSFALLVVSHHSLQFPTFFLSNDYKVILLVYQVFGRKSNYVWSDNLILWLLKMTCNDMGPLSPFCLILAKLSHRINNVGQLHICVVKTVAHCSQSSHQALWLLQQHHQRIVLEQHYYIKVYFPGEMNIYKPAILNSCKLFNPVLCLAFYLPKRKQEIPPFLFHGKRTDLRFWRELNPKISFISICSSKIPARYVTITEI